MNDKMFSRIWNVGYDKSVEEIKVYLKKYIDDFNNSPNLSNTEISILEVFQLLLNFNSFILAYFGVRIGYDEVKPNTLTFELYVYAPINFEEKDFVKVLKIDSVKHNLEVVKLTTASTSFDVEELTNSLIVNGMLAKIAVRLIDTALLPLQDICVVAPKEDYLQGDLRAFTLTTTEAKHTVEINYRVLKDDNLFETIYETGELS